jgi:hypothetical protein
LTSVEKLMVVASLADDAFLHARAAVVDRDVGESDGLHDRGFLADPGKLEIGCVDGGGEEPRPEGQRQRRVKCLHGEWFPFRGTVQDSRERLWTEFARRPGEPSPAPG